MDIGSRRPIVYFPDYKEIGNIKTFYPNQVLQRISHAYFGVDPAPPALVASQEELRNFLRQPWEYPYPTREEGSPSMGKKKTTSNVSFSRDGQAESGGTRIELHRVEDSPEHEKAPRQRIGF